MSNYRKTMADALREMYPLDEETQLDEATMSSSQIARLKKAYEPMRDKRISTSNANKLSAMMDKVGKDKEALIQLFKADIPFVSQSAATKLITKHNMKGAEINKLREDVDLDEARRGRPRKDGSVSSDDGGMENIQMQLRKSISMNGQKEVEFNDGSKWKISPGMARAVLGKIDKTQQPRDKQNASRYVAKSLSNLKAFATGKEKGMDPEVERQKILNLKSNYGSKMEAMKPYVSSDNQGKHVMNAAGKVAKSFKDMNSANEYLKRNYKTLAMVKEETQVIDEAYKAGIVDLKDGSKIRIASEDAKALNGLYGKLNASNKKQMELRMMKDKKSFNEIIAFAKETVQ